MSIGNTAKGGAGGRKVGRGAVWRRRGVGRRVPPHQGKIDRLPVAEASRRGRWHEGRGQAKSSNGRPVRAGQGTHEAIRPEDAAVRDKAPDNLVERAIEVLEEALGAAVADFGRGGGLAALGVLADAPGAELGERVKCVEGDDLAEG